METIIYPKDIRRKLKKGTYLFFIISSGVVTFYFLFVLAINFLFNIAPLNGKFYIIGLGAGMFFYLFYRKYQFLSDV